VLTAHNIPQLYNVLHAPEGLDGCLSAILHGMLVTATLSPKRLCSAGLRWDQPYAVARGFYSIT
jgi:hypothetical protein